MGARKYQIYFECWTWYLTSESSERVRYRVQHEISCSDIVFNTILYIIKVINIGCSFPLFILINVLYSYIKTGDVLITAVKKGKVYNLIHTY
jgi:hypothetical protein